MSYKDYQDVISKAKALDLLFPERSVSREDIAAVEKKLGVLFSDQMLDFYQNHGDMTIEGNDVLWLDPNDSEDVSSNLLAVTLEARRAGLDRKLIPFFNTCDKGGNIAYLDFSRMDGSEPLVTLAYYGPDGFVITMKTDYDFGEFLLRSLEGTIEEAPQNLDIMCEEEARDLLGRTPGKEEKPHSLWGRYIALALFWGSYAAMLFILCRMTSLNAAYIFLAGVLGFCICFFVTMLIFRSHVDSYKAGYLKDVEKIGPERLIKQMTSDKSRRFCLKYDQKEKNTFIVGTEDYGIFVYWCIIEWKQVYSITIKRDNHTGRGVNHSRQDEVDRFYNAFWLTIVMNDKKKKHAIVHLFHDDMLSFITYLKTKVPNIIVPVHEITLNDRTDWFLENTKRED
ncbi:MAG: SMI1/KNR4 family protein [Clostridiales bacterium]|nr:SMI1/KNR4 family protein [Clostridiales bacterium]